jgi:hypothetical protein
MRSDVTLVPICHGLKSAGFVFNMDEAGHQTSEDAYATVCFVPVEFMDPIVG